VNVSTYDKLKQELQMAFNLNNTNRIKRKSRGGPDYNVLVVRKNGAFFTRMVLSAYQSGMLQPTHASNLLGNVKVSNFNKLKQYL
jgi:hypothetical protein